MQLTETYKALDTFGKRLKKESKTSLTKKKKNASKSLYNSIDYELIVSKNSFQFSFQMEDYGDYIDKGVKGVGGTKADGTQWKKKRVTNNIYKYTNKKPPYMVFNSWVIKKGLAPRNNKGQFTSRKSLLFAISNSVYHTGLEETQFYSKPFNSAFKSLPDELINKFGLDAESFLKTI